jgi:hypothetical protein
MHRATHLDSTSASTLASRYELRGLIGQGAMGLVYRALDRSTNQEVALKTLRAIAPEDVYRLKREFRALAGVTHPNLARLHDLVVTEGQCFFTMELVEGRSFLDAAPRDLGRLRATAYQLAAGLAALHAAGKLHRDIKPTNVLVDGDGRVVILDFGLVTGLSTRRSLDSQAGALVGTLAYMAPEQAWGEAVSPAADWYSVGVMLYEAITGRVPFDGAPLAMLERKRTGLPPGALAADVPPDLAALILGLLHPEPDRRPDQAAILRVLEQAGPPAPQHPEPEIPFVGRTRELDALRGAFAESRRGAAVTITVEGESGIGKSALVRRFVAEVETDARAVVFSARCHLHESVPFKAVDGLVDELSRFLLRRPAAERDAYLPRHAAALARVFPVLGRVPAIAEGPPGGEADPHELRRRAFAALRELLARIADHHPVVLWIDDIQWSDLDSAVLLRELRQPPDPPPLLLVLSSRGGGVALDTGATVRLEPLAPGEIRRLAGALLSGRPGFTVAHAAAIADESGGNPFFVHELARHLIARSDAGERPDVPVVRLADLIAERVARLPEPARRLLELVAVAGRPLEENLAAGAAGVGDAPAALRLLEARSLLRGVVLDDAAAVETYHDRIRETVAAAVGDDERAALHHAIARALEAGPAPDPLRLVDHYLRANEPVRAGELAWEAAEAARGALAFNRAISLYRHALELGTSPCPAWQLRARLADALASAGHGREAADVYATAARALEETGGGPCSPEVLRLERCAAEQYMRSGGLEEGLAIIRRVMGSVGLALAESPTAAVVSLVANRAGRRLDELLARRALALGAVDRDRLEVLWSAGLGISVYDALSGATLQARHARLALRSGDPVHTARALATEAIVLALEGGDAKRRRAERLQLEAERVAAATGDVGVEAYTRMVAGAAAYFGNRWREAIAHCERCVALCRERGVGVAWELANAEMFIATALTYLGEFADLRVRLPRNLREADARDDQYAARNFRLGMSTLTWLAMDDPTEARRHTEAALAASPAGRYSTQHYLGIYSHGHIDLYLGDAAAGASRLRRAWPRLRASGMLRLECVRVEMRCLRARCALGLAADATSLARRRLLRRAARDARRVAAETAPWAAPLAEALRAAIDAARGRPTPAAERLSRAALGFDRCEMGLHAAACRHRLGRLAGDDALVRTAEAWMTEHGVANPPRMAGMLV